MSAIMMAISGMNVLRSSMNAFMSSRVNMMRNRDDNKDIKCVDCNKVIKGKVHYGSIDRKPRCEECSDSYEDGVYVMGDW